MMHRASSTDAVDCSFAVMQPLEDRRLLSADLGQLIDGAPAEARIVQAPAAATVQPAITNYAGTYIGQFNMQYKDLTNPKVPVIRSRGFSVTFKLKGFVSALGTSVLNITYARVSDGYFGARMGCKPKFGSIATLPVPPQNISKRAGMGFVINFPNGTVLATANAVGELHMSSDARIISNSLRNTRSSWSAVKLNPRTTKEASYQNYYLNTLTMHTTKMTWALTKSAL